MKNNISSSNQNRIFTKKISAENSELHNILLMMEKLLHWAAIIESSDDAIISQSIEGYITSWNNGAQRLYGYTSDEIIGKSVSLLMPPEKKDDFPYLMKQLREGKRIEHYVTERITKDGRILHVSITLSPLRDSHGNIIGASKIARDITERIENEKRREEFVSTASHELRTPLTSQKAFGELLEQLINKNGYTELKPYIKKINQQTAKLTKLIEDLLELSRIQTGRLKMENKKFDFDDLVDEIVETAQLTTKHTLVRKGKSKKFIKGDRERIGQVLTNLLSNATKYSPHADKVIVTTEALKKEVVVSIKDFGIGIPKSYHTKIFEKFFRVSDKDEKTYPGMGIGLHVCHDILTRHKGRIWVESVKGKGATFYFTLPFIKDKS